MLGNPDTRVFVYMNGHGGDNFFKIQDTELIHSADFAKTLTEMHQKSLYKEMLFVLDTCEAFSMFEDILEVDAPNIYLLATSGLHESAVSDETDGVLNTHR